MKQIILIIGLAGLHAAARAAIPEPEAVSALIGECGGEPFMTQVCVAEAIRHRGTLRGVYGVNNPVVRRASRLVIERARLAWERSACTNFVPGLRFFGCARDALYFRRIGMRPVIRSGAITFYK